MSSTRAIPLLAVGRALLFTLLAVVLSSGSHVLLTKAPLPWPTIVAAGGSSFVLALLLGRRERGFVAIAALLVPLELALDTLFTDGQATCYRATDGGPLLGPWHSVNTLLFCGSTTPHATTPVASLAHPTDAYGPWLVLAAHLLIGLVAAWWLRRGEAAAFALVRVVAAVVGLAATPLRRTLRLLLTALAAPPSRPSPPRRPLLRIDAPDAPLLRYALARRGPPKVLCTAC